MKLSILAGLLYAAVFVAQTNVQQTAAIDVNEAEAEVRGKQKNYDNHKYNGGYEGYKKKTTWTTTTTSSHVIDTTTTSTTSTTSTTTTTTSTTTTACTTSISTNTATSSRGYDNKYGNDYGYSNDEKPFVDYSNIYADEYGE